MGCQQQIRYSGKEVSSLGGTAMFQPCQRRATFLRVEAGGKKASDALLLQGAGSEEGDQLSTKSLSQEIVYKSRGKKRPAQGVVLQGPNLMFTPLKSQNATSLHVLYPLFVNLLRCPGNLSSPYYYLTVRRGRGFADITSTWGCMHVPYCCLSASPKAFLAR